MVGLVKLLILLKPLALFGFLVLFAIFSSSPSSLTLMFKGNFTLLEILAGYTK
jgi:hypothetical protein